MENTIKRKIPPNRRSPGRREKKKESLQYRFCHQSPWEIKSSSLFNIVKSLLGHIGTDGSRWAAAVD
jgi:hypothetical protein